VRLGVGGDNGGIEFVMTGVGVTALSVRWAAAVRVVQAHRGAVNRAADELRVRLPTEGH